jgi:aryl-alcohol dehydrogenase-like predicted oxidoreductase
VIVGPRTAEQMEENLPGFELELPAEAVRRLNEISRPPDRPRLAGR